MFRPPSLLAPQIVPTAANTPAGQPGLLRPSTTRFVTSPRIGYANRPTTGNWRYGDLHPARLRPCRLLPSPIEISGSRHRESSHIIGTFLEAVGRVDLSANQISDCRRPAAIRYVRPPLDISHCPE